MLRKCLRRGEFWEVHGSCCFGWWYDGYVWWCLHYKDEMYDVTIAAIYIYILQYVIICLYIYIYIHHMILACHRWAKFAKEPVILVWTLLRACCFAVFSHLRRWSPGPRINWVVNQLGLSELGHHFLLWWQILHRFSPLFSWQVVDTARCVKPVTFMSNMLYACSILYKTKPLSPHAPDGCRMGEDCEIQKGKK